MSIQLFSYDKQMELNLLYHLFREETGDPHKPCLENFQSYTHPGKLDTAALKRYFFRPEVREQITSSMVTGLIEGHDYYDPTGDEMETLHSDARLLGDPATLQKVFGKNPLVSEVQLQDVEDAQDIETLIAECLYEEAVENTVNELKAKWNERPLTKYDLRREAYRIYSDLSCDVISIACSADWEILREDMERIITEACAKESVEKTLHVLRTADYVASIRDWPQEGMNGSVDSFVQLAHGCACLKAEDLASPAAMAEALNRVLQVETAEAFWQERVEQAFQRVKLGGILPVEVLPAPQHRQKLQRIIQKIQQTQDSRQKHAANGLDARISQASAQTKCEAEQNPARTMDRTGSR